MTSKDRKGLDDDDHVMCDVRTGWENVGMPATRETQRSNGMKNIIFNSDKTIWDTGGQQINRRRWPGRWWHGQWTPVAWKIEAGDNVSFQKKC